MGPPPGHAQSLPIAPSPWVPVAAEAPAAGWEPVTDAATLPPDYLPPPANRDPAELAIQPRQGKPIENVGIYGIGGGINFGSDLPNSGVFTGRVGYKLNETLAVSLRPSVIFGNRDLQGRYNGETSFQLPLTLDLFRRSVVSPYLGGGIATNTYSTGQTNAMLTGGLDLNITRNITLGFNVNYVFLPDGVSFDAVQAMTLLYVKF
ncbi:outer membrane beta-barrel protein [Synechococcus sp. CCY 9618]|uniref:outer membrane beta-barrel protein n=1 Tax=Synechococcus sp. CCY 9618 TaxID=2815602 RepID=UPI001C2403BE|nr:outer membrane beta-barrel protein [Synechococcus sp. CCY 9618]